MKTPKLVITFPTTTAAMAMEALCGPEKGRLIPIPGEVSAGCGLAWCADVDAEESLLRFMLENNIKYEKKQIVALY